MLLRTMSWFSSRPLWQRSFLVAAVAGLVDTALTTHVALATTVGGLTDANTPQAVVSNLSTQYVAPTTASMSGAAAGVGSVAWSMQADKAQVITKSFGVAFGGALGTGLTVGLPAIALKGATSMGSGALVRILPHLLPHAHHIARIIGLH